MMSLRSNLFAHAPSLRGIPLKLLANAMTASSAGEKFNYQRLETLGDAVLKFLVAFQVLVEYPLWHEGYLSKKKDHTVSNVRLAKEDVKEGCSSGWFEVRSLYLRFHILLKISYPRCYAGTKMEAEISNIV